MHGSLLNEDESVTVNEIWKPIPGHEGAYEVSNLGRVRSCARKVRAVSKLGREYERPVAAQVISQQVTNAGYMLVHLYRENKRKAETVHRLVAMAFLGDADNRDVNHRNGVKTDNRLSNLEWLCRTDNHIHAVALRLNRQAIPIIGKSVSGGKVIQFPSIAEAAFALAGNRSHGSHISQAIKGTRPQAYGYLWERVA